MTNVSTWPAAGITDADEKVGRSKLSIRLRVCASTPSFIEDEAGNIVAQVFERPDPLLSEKQRLAEMWARAERMVAALNDANSARPQDGRSC